MSETKPLTEDDLVALERRIDTDWITAYSCTSCGAVNHLPADTRHDHVAMESPRLIADVRRLRQLIIDAEPYVPDNEQTRTIDPPARLKAEVQR